MPQDAGCSFVGPQETEPTVTVPVPEQPPVAVTSQVYEPAVRFEIEEVVAPPGLHN